MKEEQKQNIKAYLDEIDVALETIRGALSDININRQYIFEELSFEQEEMYAFDPAQIEDAKEKMVDSEIKNLRESPRDHSDEYKFGSQIKEALIEDED